MTMLIIIGLLLVMLDIALAPENTLMIIELLPDFIGYILILIGLRKNGGTTKETTVCLCAAVASVVLYGMKALGFAVSASMTILLFEVFELVLMLILLFILIRGIREQEQLLEQNLRAKPLFYLWLCYTLTIVLSYIFQMVTSVGSLAAMLSDALAFAILYLLFSAEQTIREQDE